MMDVNKWNWIVDKSDMTCRSVENNVIIKMEKKGGVLRGIIHDMPMELFAEIAGYADGEKIIEKIVKTAEEKYLENRPGHLVV
ncbi:MAG: hypothetical protein LBQ94_07380 [Treponema sp.]|nr:hypothetical protein [Treponema sp.]